MTWNDKELQSIQKLSFVIVGTIITNISIRGLIEKKINIGAIVIPKVPYSLRCVVNYKNYQSELETLSKVYLIDKMLAGIICILINSSRLYDQIIFVIFPNLRNEFAQCFVDLRYSIQFCAKYYICFQQSIIQFVIW